ncbi:MAG TPA: adenylate kinase [Candidatus Dormibacteraeota bacterium]
MNLLLFGAPGSGKGTQAEFLKEKYGIPQISTGEMFRAEAARGTEEGKRVDAIMKSGELVPDDLTIAIVRERLKQPDTKPGMIFDGFPRTLPQAEALDEVMRESGRRFDRALYLVAPEAELIARLAGRLTCPKDGRTFHPKFNPPPVPGICPFDGTPLIQRKDDTEETARTRVQVYLRDTMPVIDYYCRQDLVTEIDALRSIDEVRSDIEAALE